MPSREIGMVIMKAVGAESTVLSTPHLIYGVILTGAAAVDAVATITPVVNGTDVDIPIRALQDTTEPITFPAPIRCDALKATLTGTGTSMAIFYGV